MVKEQKTGTQHHHVRMSEPAYERLKQMSKQPKYRGRGVVGVLDDLILGEFTTIGSGKVTPYRAAERVRRSANGSKKSQ